MKIIKKMIKENPDYFRFFWLLHYEIRKRKYARDLRKALISSFYKKFKYIPNIECPATFNEKQLYMKLYYRNELWKKLADKSCVRDFIKENGLSSILNENYGTFDDYQSIDFNRLPDKFVMKCTHGSHMNIVCQNKYKLNHKRIKETFKTWLKVDYSNNGGEWVYSGIKPRIIIDKFLDDDLMDYRVFCFNGNPLHIHVDYDVDNTYSRVIYDRDWNKVQFDYARHNVLGKEIPKPIVLDEMLKAASILSKGIPFVRIDFFIVDNKLYFGEMTFFPSGGYGKFYPSKYDLIYGSYINLTRKNNEESTN